MECKKISHVSVTVSDFGAARPFYEEVLGLERAPRPDLPIGGAWYDLGSTQLHVIEKPAGMDVGQPAPKLTPIAGHVAFVVDDYEETVAYLKGKGLDVLETNPKMGQLWTTDPDGNVIEFTLR